MRPGGIYKYKRAHVWGVPNTMIEESLRFIVIKKEKSSEHTRSINEFHWLLYDVEDASFFHASPEWTKSNLTEAT